MFLKKIINVELSHFKQLTQKARAITWSILLYQLADISTWIFMMAYMVQKTGQVEAPAVFALGFYITLPIVYILAAKLLKRYSLRNISLFGLTGLGLMTLILFNISELTISTIFIFGLIYGIPLGLYWVARSFLYTTETKNGQRDYISGLTSSIGSMTRSTMPLIIGWLIALSPSWGWEKISSYRLLSLVGIGILIIAGLTIKKHSTYTPNITNIWVKKPSKQWKMFRAFTFLGSIQFTLALALPEALIITYLGHEGILGTVISVTSLVAGLSLYILGRQKNASKNRMKVLLFGLVPLLISSVIILVNFNYLSIILYLLAMIIFDSLYWLVFFPIFSNQIEQGSTEGISHGYRFITDHEIFSNLGRIITSIIYLLLIYKFDNRTAITAIIMLAALSQIGILNLTKKLK